ncbi:MAG: hypothetical protein WCF67_18570 [Chitinophagaceae bacterium]
MKLFCFFALVAIGFTQCTGPLRTMQPNVVNGGRAVAVTRHPANNTNLIVASETGGIFRSTNGGVNWAHVSSSTTFNYTNVLYHPLDANIVLATASNDSKTTTGGGIWRSTNGGTSWSQVAITTPVGTCGATVSGYALSFEPTSNRFWAATSCGLASSSDGGASWTFLPTSSNYNNDKTYAVLSPVSNNIKILTDAGVKVSVDGGANWTISTTGLPGYVIKGVHNQIAVSPKNHQHIFWAFNSYNFTESQWHLSLYMSANNGTSWTSLIDNPGINRAPFVKTANALTGTSSQFDIYFSDGGCRFTRATFNNATTPSISGSWVDMTHDHCDGTDAAFSTDGKTPILYTSDGGIHTTTNSGGTWAMNGGGTKGYNALQITEVIGQKHSGDAKSDLYFGTQDNNIWSSPDGGATWPSANSVCCEGFFLNIPRQALAAASTKLTGVNCGPCGNFISGPLFSGYSGFPNPPNDAGNPRLLDPGNYVHNTALTGLTASIFNFTSNNGGAWVPKYAFPEALRDLSKVSGTGAATNVFIAVRRSGSTPDGNEMLGIKRITGVLDVGTPVVSDITGFGSLGTFPTMFAWYKPFGVNMRDPNHIIVPDIIDNVVKVSRDGGASWTPDASLTNLVTQAGVFKFSSSGFTQISNISFDPDNIGHILVGTIQAGIFRSCDGGATWGKIPNSELVPYVSSFYFTGNSKAVASSYGRGLWNLDLDACRLRIRIPPVREYLGEGPWIRYQGVWIRLKDLGNPDVCPRCGVFFIRDGHIRTYSTAGNMNEVDRVVISGGQFIGMDMNGKSLPVPFKAEMGANTMAEFKGDDQLNEALAAGFEVKGIYLEGNIFKGLIVAKKDLSAQDLPVQGPPRPALRGDLVYKGNDLKKGVQGIRILGANFNKAQPLEIMIDGRPVQGVKEQYDERGVFVLQIDQPFTIGGHTILITQRTPNGVIKEAYTFNVPTHDEKRENK